MLISTLIYIQFIVWTILYTVAAAPFFTIAKLYCDFGFGDGAKTVRFFILWYGKTIIRIALFPWVRIRYENKSGEPVSGGIYVFNHRSASDPFLVSAVTGIPPVQIVNDWPMRLPFLGWFAKAGGYLDIKHLSYEEAREKVRNFTESGVPVAAFPEGTRSGGKFMNQFHSSIFHIAKEIHCPLIPVVITGNENIPNRNFRMHCGRILIRRLPAVPREFAESCTAFKLKETVRTMILRESELMDKTGE